MLPSVVMDWGGWDDWETFRQHYLGELSPEAIRRERGKVDYLDGTTTNGPESIHREVPQTGILHRH